MIEKDICGQLLAHTHTRARAYIHTHTPAIGMDGKKSSLLCILAAFPVLCTVPESHIFLSGLGCRG